jgi:hypothetical protein
MEMGQIIPQYGTYQNTITIFLVLNPSTNRNEYHKISGGKAQPACKADYLTAKYEPTV